MPIAPPPTTRGNSAGPDTPLCLEPPGGSAPLLWNLNPAAPRPGCKVVLLEPGGRAHKTHLGNKVSLPGALHRLKASGRKRTHPLASHRCRTPVPEPEIPASPVPIRAGDPRPTLCFLEAEAIGPSAPRPSDAFLTDAAWAGRGPPGGCTGAVLTQSDLIAHPPSTPGILHSLSPQGIKLL